MPEDTADYRRLFLDDVPMMDVRAPVEFVRGAFPTAVNLPLMIDPERERVGIRYKAAGQDAAVKLGHELVSGELKAARVVAWAGFARQHPDGVLYCFRGGMRSAISQQWLREAGVDYPRVIGGYKAMRQFLLEALARIPGNLSPHILGGRTGSGKTRVLTRVRPGIDLEALANHRGSGFGRRATPQPAQIDFENALAVALLKHEAAGHERLLLEDESRNIGSRSIPEELQRTMKAAPLVVLEVPFEERVTVILEDYVIGALDEFAGLYAPAEAHARFGEHLAASLDRIRRRLGGERHARLRAIMDGALTAQREQGDASGHRLWIAELLRDYYDPMYDYQLSRNRERMAFQGEYPVVLDYLARQGFAVDAGRVSAAFVELVVRP